MTPQELKNSILQRAIQGKLVEQRSEEGTSVNLVKLLLAKKKEWADLGIILRKVETKPFCSADELSELVIPDSWTWVQLADVSIIQEGAGIRKWQYRDSGTQILCVTNILDGAIDLQKKQLFISTEEYKEKYRHLTLCAGDIVTSCSGGSWGKTAIFDCSETMMLNTSTLRLRFFDDIACNKYLYFLTKSDFFKQQLVRQLSGMQPNFGYAHYSRIMIPLPPLAEQKRIVAKIEELLPLIDRYEAAWSRLEEFNKRFPGDMQKSLLQMAIQGKLVEQRPEEGTGEELFQQIQAEKQALIKAGKIKKDKPLPEITDDEKPFDIPESWKWVRLGNLISVKSGEGLTASQMQAGDIPVYGGNGITGYHNQSIIHEETVVIGRVGFYCGSVHVTEREAWVTDNAFITTYPQRYIFRDYLVYMLRHMDLGQNNNATAQPVVSGKKIYPLLFPLPPLAEQKRIVAKLEELLPICERLK